MNFEQFHKKAMLWATEAHTHKTKDGKPQEYDGKPYTVHLASVEKALKRFGITQETEQGKVLLIAAWLHDIIEDTTVTYDEVRWEMGDEIANLVYAVTNEAGVNRKERHLKTYPKIKNHPYAIILKLADRIANTEASLALEKEGKMGFMKMYHKEYPGFRENLKGELASEMWAHLDALMGVK